MFTIQQLTTMGHMQNDMQCAQLGDVWTCTTQHNYGRAISVEAHEAMEHVGFKWWKDKETDWDQLKMELIDILHFELCNVIQLSGHIEPDEGSVAYLWEEWENIKRVEKTKDYLLSKLDKISRAALINQRVLILLFPLFKACDLNGDDVFKLYVGKNVLNKFRRDNGYKDGSYIKDWAGNEDNVQLTKILNVYTGQEEDFPELLYGALDAEYDHILKLNGRYKSY